MDLLEIRNRIDEIVATAVSLRVREKEGEDLGFDTRPRTDEQLERQFHDWRRRCLRFYQSDPTAPDLPEIVGLPLADLQNLAGWCEVAGEQKQEGDGGYTKPASLKVWAEIFRVSVSTIRRWRDDPTNGYHFDKVSDRKWRLPKREVPAEYLEKYRSNRS